MGKFVLQIPKWQGELVFTRETLVFAAVVLLLIIGILFCFWGYKFFGTILFMGIGTAACYGGYLLVEPLTGNLVLRMFLTVSLTFVGVCFAYFLHIIGGYMLDRVGGGLRIKTVLGKRIYLLAAPLGAAILGLTIYYMIWRDGIISSLISVVCLTVGLIFQHVKRKEQVQFKSYDDLMKLSRPAFDGNVPETAAMDTETTTAAAVTAETATAAEAAATAETATAADEAAAAGGERKGGNRDCLM